MIYNYAHNILMLAIYAFGFLIALSITGTIALGYAIASLDMYIHELESSLYNISESHESE